VASTNQILTLTPQVATVDIPCLSIHVPSPSIVKCVCVRARARVYIQTTSTKPATPKCPSFKCRFLTLRRSGARARGPKSLTLCGASRITRSSGSGGAAAFSASAFSARSNCHRVGQIVHNGYWQAAGYKGRLILAERWQAAGYKGGGGGHLYVTKEVDTCRTQSLGNVGL